MFWKILVFFTVSGVAWGNAAERARLVEYHGCLNRLLDSGGRDAFATFSPADGVAVMILKNQSQIEAVYNVVDQTTSVITHARYLSQFKSGFPISPQRSIQMQREDRNKVHGPAYLQQTFGDALSKILDGDTRLASDTLRALDELRETMRVLAYCLKYLKTWREIWMTDYTQDGNLVFGRTRNWPMAGHYLNCLKTTETTDQSLAPDESGLFRAKTMEPTVNLDNWDSSFPADHLPLVGRGALSYLHANLAQVYFPKSPVLNSLLADLSRRVARFDRLVGENLARLVGFQDPSPPGLEY